MNVETETFVEQLGVEKCSMKNIDRRWFIATTACVLALRPNLARAEASGSEGDTARRLLEAVPILGEMSLGHVAAPIVMIEYSSPTCKFTPAFNEEVWPGIKRDFVEPGQVRMIFREFPMDQLALNAFMLARCISPDKYFQAIDLMLKRQATWRGKDAGPPLFRIMQEFGMTQDQFESCVRNEEIGRSIVETAGRARSVFGVKATPTFFINGRMIVAQEDQMSVRRMIEEEIAKL